jgi:vancomycin resistance protein YoaR
MKRGWLTAWVLVGVSLLGLGAGALLWGMAQSRPLPTEFRLGGIALEGVHPTELPEWLQELNQTLSALPVRVDGVSQEAVPLREWGVQLDVPRVQAAILQAWHRVPVWQKLMGDAHAQIDPSWQVDEARFKQRLRAFRSLERAPRDARVRYQEGMVVIEPEEVGCQLAVEASLQNLLRACGEWLQRAQGVRARVASSEQALQPTHSEVRFSLAYRVVAPRITEAMLRPIEGVVASYTTSFPGYQVNRNHNIRLAAAALDGRILLPGERLSYNEVVGERTLKQGFRLAPIIVRGEKRLGVGGGICQVSSTLFNAALLAELKVVRRANHSIPVPYVPLGRDATVTDTGLDLVIENSLPYPVAFSVEVGRSRLTVRVLGKPIEGRQVRLTTQRVSLSPTRVVLWRWVYQDGRLLRREQVAVSTYRPPKPQGTTRKPSEREQETVEGRQEPPATD